MTRRAGVLGNAVMLVGSGLAERGASLVVALLVSRALGADGLGVYVAVIAYFQLLTVAAELGVSNHLVREIARDPGATGRWMAHAGELAVLAAVAVSGVAFLVLPHLGMDEALREGTTIVLFGLVPAALNVVSRAVLVAHQRVVHDAVANAAGATVLVVSGWLLVRGGAGVNALLVSYVATRVLITTYCLVVIHRRIAPLRADLDVAFARHLLRGLRPFAGSTIVGALFARPELLLLSALASPAQVGYFAAAFKAVDLWQLLPETYMLSAYPVLARAHEQDPAGAASMQRTAATGLLFLGLPLTAGVVLTAEPLIRLLYGPGFEDAAPLLRLMAVLAALFCVHTVQWRSLSARGEQATVLRIQVPMLLVRLSVGAVLIASFGAIGAAVTVPLALGAHNVALSRAVRRTGPGVVDVRQLLPAVAGTVAMVSAVLAVGTTSLVGTVSVAVPVYLLVVVLLSRRSVADRRPVLTLPTPEREPT